MTHSVWRIAADTPEYTADDLSGAGAKATGGRWNEKGVAMLYTAESIAMACLETVVHLGANTLPLNRYLVRIDLPDAIYRGAQRLDASEVGWDARPAGFVSIDAGSQWARSRASACLLVPSVIIPEEMNALINPEHPDAARIKATKVRRFDYDPRLLAD